MKKHSDSEATTERIVYRGKKVTENLQGTPHEYYSGFWQIIDKQGHPFVQGKFILEQPSPSKTLDFLMRKDADKRRHEKPKERTERRFWLE